MEALDHLRSRRSEAQREPAAGDLVKTSGGHRQQRRRSGEDREDSGGDLHQQPVGMGSPAVAPYGAYRTADGQTVVLGTTNDREWQRFARDLLGRPDLADDERFRTTSGRAEHRGFLDAEIADWCARHDLTQVQSDADAAGIGNARFNTPSEVIAHPHLMARDRWRRIDTPHGQVPALLPPPVIAGYEPPMGGIPALGQHTDALLTELGVTEDDIAVLRAQGAAAPTPG
ncbi:CoA transferase [Streptomyces violaceus]|uniref:CoA transferase n=1 Tax=Streptomyces violaceus TaxID=1936 RepID=UPI0039A6B765